MPPQNWATKSLSFKILYLGLTRRVRGAALDESVGQPPRKCHNDQWLVNISEGELGGKDLATEFSSVAPTLASHPRSMLVPGVASTNRKHTVDSLPLTICDVIFTWPAPCTWIYFTLTSLWRGPYSSKTHSTVTILYYTTLKPSGF